jgi:exodeoxyribonuclease VII large subunit
MQELGKPGLNREVLSVSGLNQSVRRLLEGEFPMVWVEGEISNFARPSSGHWYFTLKDQAAQVRCAMFRNRNQLQRSTPANGTHVIVRGRISLYEGRGEFQLIAEHIEEGGDGALRRAYEQLKMKLQTEGLFDQALKKPLPAMPRHLGIITSPTGAAIHDVLTVLRRRFPAIRVSILPVSVQGATSAAEIRRQLAVANDYRADPFDVLLLTRGGGSLEDFASFNSEVVARAVARSELPVVCAVGHESDVSIADFVADLRAATPSAAAELISPDSVDWLARIAALGERLVYLHANAQQRRATRLADLERRLHHPGRRLEVLHQRLDELEGRLSGSLKRSLRQPGVDAAAGRLHAAMSRRLQTARSRLGLAHKSLTSPAARIREFSQQAGHLEHRMSRSAHRAVETRAGQLHSLVAKLNALSPLATLERGYAIATDHAGHVVTDARSVAPGDQIEVRLNKGRLVTEVRETHED